ncbi:bifunctional diguanylate cyclase/phosphodiesterase [Undibacterium sp.]|jgi:diguanylate cyclase (GGDEF)-like protein/PAS domain S-box-containing protein|uniref:bifunctional diguanylate cyclase/phosphodiesterase n=1 Tax=Undibacterium sp. TaxID=1914977 RepID=UPI002C02CC1F|nr:EAL domain-containing protein [Undibacterium sp.]HTD05996.1 EAL domain-containing protein [Undibacterium sp.]
MGKSASDGTDRPGGWPLKIELALAGTLIFVFGICMLSWFVVEGLRKDFEQVVAVEQATASGYVARTVDRELGQRVKALQMIADHAGELLKSDPGRLQGYLDDKPVTMQIFSRDIFVISKQGVRVAEAPERGFVGTSYIDSTYFKEVMATGKPVIKPTFGRFAKQPVLVVAVPLFGPDGSIDGVLCGSELIDAGSPFYFAGGMRNGETGGFHLVSRKEGVIVASTDPGRVLQPVPPKGKNSLFDRRMQGYVGPGVTVDSTGTEVLSTAARAAMADWLVIAYLPTAEAFVPVRGAATRIYVGAIGISLFGGLLIWLLVRRKLAPLEYAAAQMGMSGSGENAMAPLPVTGSSEIRLLLGNFNRLQAYVQSQQDVICSERDQLEKTTAEREEAVEALRQSDSNFRSMLDSMLEGCQIVGFDWRYRYINDAAQRQNGVPSETLLGRLVMECWPGFAETEIFALEKDCMELRTMQSGQFEFTYPDGRKGWFRVIIQPIPEGIVIFSDDISERIQADADLRIAAAAFDSQEGMVVTDANDVILRVNRAFTEITGYAVEDAVGKTPQLFQSDAHSEDDYRARSEVIDRTGSWQGEVWSKRKNGETYPQWLTISAVTGSSGAVTHYVHTLSDISERKRAADKIQELAFFDQLTGLPNRRLLLDRLKQAMTAALRSGSFGALMFIDLDDFKALNDTLGHDMGDSLLKQAAQRLTACVREGDTVARLGGDEFVVVLAGLGVSERDAVASTEKVVGKILAVLRNMFELGDASHQSTASIGITLFCGQPVTIDELMKQADLAMYRSKSAGRNAFRFFDPAMQTAAVQRVVLATDLRKAIDGDQFLLHYQAQVIDGGSIIGAEVLVRWQHPQRGLVSPAEFIPLAEETGLILPLGFWVLETACVQLAKWAARPEMAHLTIAVNVSARQFGKSDFVDHVLTILKKTGANANRLKLELTETLLVDNVQDTIEKMFALKAKGVGFSLDDFGTGYSSLSYLKRLPLDQLKIDQSFVRDVLIDPNDAAIARTIVALAQSLGLGVIAEGVETEAQRDFLAAAGCHCYQGYFFSRPLALDGFERLALGAAYESVPN